MDNVFRARQRLKERIKQSSSVEEFARSIFNKNSSVAFESYESSAINKEVTQKFKDYITQEIVQVILNAKIFFSAAPEQALQELEEVLEDEQVRKDVIKFITREFNAVDYSSDLLPEEELQELRTEDALDDARIEVERAKYVLDRAEENLSVLQGKPFKRRKY